MKYIVIENNKKSMSVSLILKQELKDGNKPSKAVRKSKEKHKLATTVEGGKQYTAYMVKIKKSIRRLG